MRADGVRQAAIGIGVLLALGGLAGAQEWTAQEIVDRAVARADAQRDAQDDIRYRATFEAITERLNGALLHEYPLRVGRRGPHFSGPSAGATLRG